MAGARARPINSRNGHLEAVFPHVRATLDELGVDLPLHELYLEEHCRGTHRECICIAPHGAGIEPWTRFMARMVYDRVDCDYWSAWADFYRLLDLGLPITVVDPTCKRLHVTSHRIWEQPVLYRELTKLVHRRADRYALAVAIHGKGDDAADAYHVEVGGTSALRHTLVQNLAAHGIAARDGKGKRAGRNPANIVNLLGRESIQVEIPRSYRRHPVFGYAITQAVAEVIERFAPTG